MNETDKKERTIEEMNANARPVKLQLREGAKLEPVIAAHIMDIIEGKRIFTKEEIERKGEDFKQLLQSLSTHAMANLTFEHRDEFERKIEGLLSNDTKRLIWDRNHIAIIAAISNLTRDHNRFPTRSELSVETKLTRATINKHLKEYFGGPEHAERQEEILIMRERVLAAAFKFALQGDAKAAKVFLQATANQQPAITNQQNNYIQFNGTMITAEQLKALPEEQQLQLNKILFLEVKKKKREQRF